MRRVACHCIVIVGWTEVPVTLPCGLPRRRQRARRAAAEQQRAWTCVPAPDAPELPRHRRRAGLLLPAGAHARRGAGAADRRRGPPRHAALLEPGPHEQQVRRALKLPMNLYLDVLAVNTLYSDSGSGFRVLGPKPTLVRDHLVSLVEPNAAGVLEPALIYSECAAPNASIRGQHSFGAPKNMSKAQCFSGKTRPQMLGRACCSNWARPSTLGSTWTAIRAHDTNPRVARQWQHE